MDCVYRTQVTRYGLVWVNKTDNIFLRTCYVVKRLDAGTELVLGTIVVQDNDVADQRWLIHIRPGCEYSERFAVRKKVKTRK